MPLISFASGAATARAQALNVVRRQCPRSIVYLDRWAAPGFDARRSMSQDLAQSSPIEHTANDRVLGATGRRPPSPKRPANAPSAVSLSEQESQAFAEMYRSIFSQPTTPHPRTPPTHDATRSPKHETPTSKEIKSDSQSPTDHLGSFFKRAEKRNQMLKEGVLTPSGQLRSRSSLLLDEKVAEIEACNNDLELLKWADSLFSTQREVEVASKAGSKRKGVKKGKAKETNAENLNVAQDVSTTAQAAEGLDSLTRSSHLRVYPHLLSLLMRTFRERYADPFISLSLFHHARRLSVFSYVYGCTTPVYNELLDTL
ncbi:hypothetical protein FRB90_010411, partial [Tulasnella sp. 427]